MPSAILTFAIEVDEAWRAETMRRELARLLGRAEGVTLNMSDVALDARGHVEEIDE